MGVCVGALKSSRLIGGLGKTTLQKTQMNYKKITFLMGISFTPVKLNGHALVLISWKM